MNIKIGCDIVKISRIKNLGGNALKKIFHPNELKDSRPEHLSGVFAVKEAVFKALGIKPCWLDVEVGYEKSGRPFLKLSPEIKKAVQQVDCSIAHDENCAIAFVAVILN